jgi:hypothetical protein
LATANLVLKGKDTPMLNLLTGSVIKVKVKSALSNNWFKLLLIIFRFPGTKLCIRFVAAAINS